MAEGGTCKGTKKDSEEGVDYLIKIYTTKALWPQGNVSSFA